MSSCKSATPNPKGCDDAAWLTSTSSTMRAAAERDWGWVEIAVMVSSAPVCEPVASCACGGISPSCSSCGAHRGNLLLDLIAIAPKRSLIRFIATHYKIQPFANLADQTL